MENTNDIRQVENNFIRNLGNGVKAVEWLTKLMQAVVQSRDTTIITRIMLKMDQNSDEAAARSVRMVVGQIYPKAKLSKHKVTGEYTLKIKGIEADKDAVARLVDAAERGLSIRHAAFRKAIMPEVEAKEFVLVNFAKRAAKKAHKEDEKLSKAAFLAAMSAAWDAENE